MKRNASLINKSLVIKDNKIYTTEKTIIEFPKWFEDKDLVDIQETAYVYGIFAIIVGDNYSVSVIPTLIPTKPIIIKEIERDGIIYTQFIYGKGDCLVEDTHIVKRDILSYNFFETFFVYAKEPWYIDYEDVIRCMDNLVPYAKSGVGSNHIASELVVSFITRVKGNKKKFYRQGDGKSGYEYVDLMNVFYSARGLNVISGNYFTNSLTSAIVNPSKDVTKLEELVR